jgi:NADH dehydrogenase (ubiquinone) 1 alpha subcomplex subunit 7
MIHRTIPPADLPPGPSHKIAANYYFTRESRRGVNPPEILAPQQKLLDSPNAQVAVAEEARPKLKTPGPYYNHSV